MEKHFIRHQKNVRSTRQQLARAACWHTSHLYPQLYIKTDMLIKKACIIQLLGCEHVFNGVKLGC